MTALLVDTTDRVRTLTLNRPQSLTGALAPARCHVGVVIGLERHSNVTNRGVRTRNFR